MFASIARAFTSPQVTLRSLSLGRSPISFVGKTTTNTVVVPRYFSTGSPETSVVEICKQKIQDALEADEVKVTGAYDDPNGSHISIEVVSSKFEGKRPVQRQQLVYKAIWKELQGSVHAVDSMVCKTPAEK
ncbi:hypothetical protein ACA910_016841 [Epithemia clementina (nom. ined.)]